MVQYYQRPENALKRAEELIRAKQEETALQSLYDVIMAKKNRIISLVVLEPIVEKFVELAVQLRKGKMAKEALHQFKNICLIQGNDINIKRCVDSIKKNIDSFIKLSEEELEKAQAKADKINLNSIEDLEASETPESILLSSVSSEVSKDRTNREVVTPWLKFLWEAYRTALDILRNNSRLEDLYQEVVKQAFDFCLKYQRKNEFHRLCDSLRLHLQTTLKYSNQPNSIDLNKEDTLKRHLEARFIQLNVAAELEFWQEAYKTVEDIYNLLDLSKKAPKDEMLINYYEKLAKVFLVSENYLFHAAAWSKYFTLNRRRENITEEELGKMASVVLMSALAIPIITTAKTHNDIDDRSKLQRLCNLLRVNTVPTREILIREALEKNVLSHVSNELKELYNILEVQFHPLSFGKKIKPIIEKLSVNEDLNKYIQPLYNVILTRLLQQLSQIYTTIKINTVVNLIAFKDNAYDSFAIEKFIMNGCKKGELNIRINHENQSLTFGNDPFISSKGSISEGPRLQSLPSEQMRMQLARLAKRLQTVILLINPETVDIKRESKEITINQALENLQKEKNIINERIKIIEKKKEYKEQENTQREEEEQMKRAAKKKQEEEAKKAKLLEEAKKKEEDRLNKLRIENEKAEAKRLAEKLAEEAKQKNLNIKPEDLENLDTAKLKELQIKQVEEEKREKQRKIEQLTKRLDYTDRAYRIEEIPLLKKDYEEQKKTDRANYVALCKRQLEVAKVKHEEGMKLKKSMVRMLDDYKKYKDIIIKRRTELIRAEAEKEYEQAMLFRKESYRIRKIDEKRKKLREEESRRQLEEIERKRIEEEDRKERERKEKEQREAEERRLLDIQTEKQREAELRAEQKMMREKEMATSNNVWRPRVLAERSSSSGEKYVPPSQRMAQAKSPAQQNDDEGWTTAFSSRKSARNSRMRAGSGKFDDRNMGRSGSNSGSGRQGSMRGNKAPAAFNMGRSGSSNSGRRTNGGFDMERSESNSGGEKKWSHSKLFNKRG
ncbi:hypothetical protein LY90DRAFT_667452 [Neocallimastix californiae]|jgi:translation initiation factor 3 subunit A|uniref:Eukaryotic translation initiation factor 3 subunit A n=1 Tax=Neocallimastix californiae TaxID=1754190 RepID=A0A1Y2ECN3_9FUNG|nr:hypothetical protein LY90DRAFT_667452 [Neocallimastix californiae]|eukprot:ORY69340.1 hypothetical protein LY90DRAFT_667452 [Neocallimastix californiae]